MPRRSLGWHCFHHLRAGSECREPILLNGKVDEHGQPRIKLDWRLSDDDPVTMREAAFEFGRYLIRAEIGRLNVNPVVLSSAHPLQGWTALGAAPGAAGHQMGERG